MVAGDDGVDDGGSGAGRVGRLPLERSDVADGDGDTPPLLLLLALVPEVFSDDTDPLGEWSNLVLMSEVMLIVSALLFAPPAPLESLGSLLMWNLRWKATFERSVSFNAPGWAGNAVGRSHCVVRATWFT